MRTIGGRRPRWRKTFGPVDPRTSKLDRSRTSEASRTEPVFDYDSGVQASVIGGFVYRGQALPQLQGMYVYGRFGQQEIHALTPNPSGGRALDDVRLFSTATQGGRPWSVGEDAAGELYVTFGSRLRARRPGP